MLENSHHLIQHGPGHVLIAGVPDPIVQQFQPGTISDPGLALKRELSRDGVRSLDSLVNVELRILLAHRPGACFEASRAGYDLQLSGHTHAEQFYPWAFYVPWAHPYSRGLNLHDKTWVYVNAGTGYWGPPNRFGVPSEITLLRVSG